MPASRSRIAALTVAVSMCLGGCATIDAERPPRLDSLVALINSSASSDEYYEAQFCGGIAISADVVVTAAHCVSDRDASTFDVLWGVSSLCDGSRGHRAHVARIVLDDSLPHDLAVLELREPLIGDSAFGSPGFDSGVPDPVKVRIGSIVLATGWGRLSSRGVPPCQVRTVQLEVVEADRCASIVDDAADPGDVLCTMPRSSINTCEGDSGGPVAAVVGEEQIAIAVTVSGEGCGPLDAGVSIRLDREDVWSALGRGKLRSHGHG